MTPRRTESGAGPAWQGATREQIGNFPPRSTVQAGFSAARMQRPARSWPREQPPSAPTSRGARPPVPRQRAPGRSYSHDVFRSRTISADRQSVARARTRLMLLFTRALCFRVRFASARSGSANFTSTPDGRQAGSVPPSSPNRPCSSSTIRQPRHHARPRSDNDTNASSDRFVSIRVSPSAGGPLQRLSMTANSWPPTERTGISCALNRLRRKSLRWRDLEVCLEGDFSGRSSCNTRRPVVVPRCAVSRPTGPVCRSCCGVSAVVWWRSAGGDRAGRRRSYPARFRCVVGGRTVRRDRVTR